VGRFRQHRGRGVTNGVSEPLLQGELRIAWPNGERYRVVRNALSEALERSRPLARAATIRPYLQAFTLAGASRATHHMKSASRSARPKSWASTLGALESPQCLSARFTPPLSRSNRDDYGRCAVAPYFPHEKTAALSGVRRSARACSDAGSVDPDAIPGPELIAVRMALRLRVPARHRAGPGPFTGDSGSTR